MPILTNALRLYTTDKGTFQIRFGEKTDIDRLVALNSKWCVPSILNTDTTNGFIFGKPFNYEEFVTIVAHSEIVVALIKEKIVGYYLFDNFSNNTTSLDYERRITDLAKKGLIDPNRVCRRAQVVVDTPYHGLGLYRELFLALNAACKKKYDKVFSVAHKQNPKLAINYRIGWKVINDDEDYLNVYYDLA